MALILRETSGREVVTVLGISLREVVLGEKGGESMHYIACSVCGHFQLCIHLREVRENDALHLKEGTAHFGELFVTLS